MVAKVLEDMVAVVKCTLYFLSRVFTSFLSQVNKMREV